MAECNGTAVHVEETTEQNTEANNVENANLKPSLRVGKLKLTKRNYKLCLRVELAALLLLIAVIWGVLAVPIFIFYLSEVDGNQTANISGALGEFISGNVSNGTCNQDFYLRESENSSFCSPNCNWKEVTQASSDTTDALVALLVAVGVLVGILVLITGCIRRKRVFTFPSILVIYHNITWLVIGITVLISLTDRDTLYCVSGDQIQSVLHSTGFCVFSGIIFYYGILQLLCWWICHVSILFWKIRWPFQARSWEKSNKIKYVHAACVVGSLLIPLIPVLVTISHDLLTNEVSDVGTVGFTITRFPPLLCSSVDSEAIFYSLVIPLILLLDTGLALLILMFWFVHKQTGSFKVNQSKNPFKIGTAEKKLLVILFYYIILAVFALITFTLFSRTIPQFFKELFDYYICEQSGPETTCDRSGFEDLTNPVPANISFVLLALNTWMNLIFTVNFKELKEFFTRCVHRTKHMVLKEYTSSTSGNNMNVSTASRENGTSQTTNA